jgi:hypothetical protein
MPILEKNIGSALASTATEMSVAVNQFAQTPIGILATVIIVYKLIGSNVMQFIVGLFFFAIAMPTWFYIYKRTVLIESKVVTESEGKKVTKYNYCNANAETQFAYIMLGLALIAIGCIIK